MKFTVFAGAGGAPYDSLKEVARRISTSLIFKIGDLYGKNDTSFVHNLIIAYDCSLEKGDGKLDIAKNRLVIYADRETVMLRGAMDFNHGFYEEQKELIKMLEKRKK